MAVVHVYLIPGTMTRVPDDWCRTCQVPSVWTGPVWRLSPTGIALHGQITGCADCDAWHTEPADSPAATDAARPLRSAAPPAGPG